MAGASRSARPAWASPWPCSKPLIKLTTMSQPITPELVPALRLSPPAPPSWTERNLRLMAWLVYGLLIAINLLAFFLLHSIWCCVFLFFPGLESIATASMRAKRLQDPFRVACSDLRSRPANYLDAWTGISDEQGVDFKRFARRCCHIASKLGWGADTFLPWDSAHLILGEIPGCSIDEAVTYFLVELEDEIIGNPSLSPVPGETFGEWVQRLYAMRKETS